MPHSTLSSLKYSVRAVSTAFYALLCQNTPAQIESCKWYMAGLNRHRKFLSSSSSTFDKIELPGVEEVLISILLCLFEVYACTSSAGCFQYLAACRALELKGPQNCQSGGGVHRVFHDRVAGHMENPQAGKSTMLAQDIKTTFGEKSYLNRSNCLDYLWILNRSC